MLAKLAPDDVNKVLRAIEVAGVTLTYFPAEDRLNAQPSAALTPEIIFGIRNHKAEIVDVVRAKLARESAHASMGLIATWSRAYGYISIHDSTTGEWHDLAMKDAPAWAAGESRRRKELYSRGDYRAYRLTAREMEEIWESERPDIEEGIVEDHPIEEEGEGSV